MTAAGPLRSPSPRLARFAWAVLAYNLLVIAWGAFVRATGSGAGCGRHWPLCNGEVVPRATSIATLIEASHRATSGLALVLVLGLAFYARRVLPKGHRVRRSSTLSAVFILGEALIGAGLVLFELVAHDTSMKRALSTVLHLGNTFLLLAALAFTAYWSSRDGVASESRPPATPARADRILRGALLFSTGGVLLLAASGAIAALGDTLFPARSLGEGLAADLSPVAHAFLRLRMFHPLIALVTGLFVLATAGYVRVARRGPRTLRLARFATVAFVTQFAAGLLNVFLLAPVAMQLLHLLLADLTWIALVLMAWEALWGDGRGAVVAAVDQEAFIMSRNGPGPSSDIPPSTRNVDPVT